MVILDTDEDTQTDMPKYNLTNEEKAARLRFKAAWDSWKQAEKGRSQQWMAEQLDMTQSSFSAYLIGRTPLNIKVLLKVCTIMDANPRDIYPELFEKIDIPSPESSSDRAELIEIIRGLPDEKVSVLKVFLKTIL